MRENVTFNIQNTTNGTIPVSILGNNADPMDNANATTRYFWNISSLTITNEQSIYIEYKTVGQPSFSTLTTNFSGNSIQNVVDALNTLNIGSFFITTSGASTFINNYNNNLVFGILSIYSSNTTALSYVVTMVNGGGSATIQKNAVVQVTFTPPVTTTGSVSVVNNDAIIFSGTTNSTGNNTIIIEQLNTQTNVTTQIVNVLIVGALTPFTYNFNTLNGFTYLIKWSD
jgi:hypothetical protein